MMKWKEIMGHWVWNTVWRESLAVGKCWWIWQMTINSPNFLCPNFYNSKQPHMIKIYWTSALINKVNYEEITRTYQLLNLYPQTIELLVKKWVSHHGIMLLLVSCGHTSILAQLGWHTSCQKMFWLCATSSFHTIWYTVSVC